MAGSQSALGDQGKRGRTEGKKGLTQKSNDGPEAFFAKIGVRDLVTHDASQVDRRFPLVASFAEHNFVR